MTYDFRTRDRYRATVAVVTGAVGATAITATGWVAGTLAYDAQDEATQQATNDVASREAEAAGVAGHVNQRQRPRTVIRERPVKTRITLRYVAAASSSSGVGGTVSTGTTRSQPAPSPHAAPPPAPGPAPAPAPAPPPPPAPTNGS